MRSVQITTPSRLHFGLIDLNGEIGRVDGSVGLALDRPCFRLRATRSESVHIEGAGSYRTRVEAIIARLRAIWDVGGIALEFSETIPPHSGLGSGTQLTLAVIHALAALYEVPVTREEAVRLSGRGGTSGIGVHAFYEGGFLVDGGHRFPEQKSEFLPSGASADVGAGPLLVRHDFPDWDILLVLPEARHVSGEEEVRLFQTLCPMPASSGATVCHWLVMGVLPSLVERDRAAFARALERMQAVGWKQIEIDAQEPIVRKTIAFLRDAGADGVAMSSWGPALAAFAPDAEALCERVRAFLASTPSGGTAFVTRANNAGATIEVIE